LLDSLSIARPSLLLFLSFFLLLLSTRLAEYHQLASSMALPLIRLRLDFIRQPWVLLSLCLPPCLIPRFYVDPLGRLEGRPFHLLPTTRLHPCLFWNRPSLAEMTVDRSLWLMVPLPLVYSFVSLQSDETLMSLPPSLNYCLDRRTQLEASFWSGFLFFLCPMLPQPGLII